ncbi:MAG: DUF3109 family protein [Bacteroidota bacterium]
MEVVPDILIDSAIPATRFACDLRQCKGACCTMPGHRGAPLMDAEVEEIRKALPVVLRYIPTEHREQIERDGFLQGTQGDWTTACINKRACVFVFQEDGIAHCSFEKAFHNGEISWRKPISCHLFPIRVDNGLQERLRFESLAECQPALERGMREGISLAAFLKDSLTRAYGAEWYEEFLRHCREKQRGT